MINFLMIMRIPIWMAIIFLLIIFVVYITKPEPFDENKYWKDEGYYKIKGGGWTKHKFSDKEAAKEPMYKAWNDRLEDITNK